MSLYVCDECGCIENTALTRFWFRDRELDGKALCSACDTEGPWKGEWHGRFPRNHYDPSRHKPAYVNGKWTDRGAL